MFTARLPRRVHVRRVGALLEYCEEEHCCHHRMEKVCRLSSSQFLPYNEIIALGKDHRPHALVSHHPPQSSPRIVPLLVWFNTARCRSWGKNRRQSPSATSLPFM